MNRTHNNGELRISDVNKIVELKGWVAKKRNLGSLVFIDLRDRYGITQIVLNEEMEALGKDIKNEYVLHVVGKVIERSSKNPNMPTGDIEIEAAQIDIINTAKVTPIYTTDDTDASEDARMQYRYLDLRRPVMQNKIIMRHKITSSIRNFLDNHEFIDIETPYLNRSTPEGARDFLVPSRVHNGSFYALPQSPQLFKQLLMMSGFDKYYQIAKCFRDEDLRANRQPEFTQVDMELSFVEEDDVMEFNEGLIAHVFKEVAGVDVKLPIKRMTYKDAMEKYGSDKPDLRFGMEITDITADVKDMDFVVFKSAIEAGGSVRALCLKGGADLGRKPLDKLGEFVKTYKAKGLAWIQFKEDGIKSSISKFLTDEVTESIKETMNAENGDAVLIVADKNSVVFQSLGALRLHLAKEFDLIKDKNEFNFTWVTEFPLFEYSEEEGRYMACHHPFTAPMDEDLEYVESDPGRVRSKAYDLVLNGEELGGGSIRIHDTAVQERMLKALGFTHERAWESFGFLLQALKFGAPPHGGLAYGLDRMVMFLAGTENIKDVIAFPKNQNAYCYLSEAPNIADEKQLAELGISILPKENKKDEE